MNLQSTITLHNQVQIPRLGLGVYQSPAGKATFDSVLHALMIGYRHIDTAAIYGNEADVGRAIRESGVARESIFVTTKLWNADQGYDGALRAFDVSLETLGLEYVDLYLIHWPVEGKRQDSWRALEKIYADKRAKSIGVSNFTIKHLQELSEKAKTQPMVNQVEFSPFLYQKELLQYCADHKVVVEAYSPLTKGKKLNDSRLVAIAKGLNRTPAQVLIRWALQKDLVVLPKSNHAERIQENSNVFDFEIKPQEMGALDKLNENYRASWDPTSVR